MTVGAGKSEVCMASQQAGNLVLRQNFFVLREVSVLLPSPFD